ncbi:MAG: hypothetical protein LUB59_03870 [Candidatus Gastranaerophilales bacterium]|nr:hypothetical protein [Candidatus Gastranaerophilales bacterium]
MKKEEILKKIAETDEQIRKFKLRIKSSDLCRNLYDNAVLQKAILKKELDDYDKNRFFERVKKLLPKKKTLICDYFKP